MAFKYTLLKYYLSVHVWEQHSRLLYCKCQRNWVSRYKSEYREINKCLTANVALRIRTRFWRAWCWTEHVNVNSSVQNPNHLSFPVYEVLPTFEFHGDVCEYVRSDISCSRLPNLEQSTPDTLPAKTSPKLICCIS